MLLAEGHTAAGRNLSRACIQRCITLVCPDEIRLQRLKRLRCLGEDQLVVAAPRHLVGLRISRNLHAVRQTDGVRHGTLCQCAGVLHLCGVELIRHVVVPTVNQLVVGTVHHAGGVAYHHVHLVSLSVKFRHKTQYVLCESLLAQAAVLQL